MRNDARPIGPESGHQSPVSDEHSSDVVNRGDENVAPPGDRPQSRGRCTPTGSDPENDPTMPANDSTLNTKS
jgi:hypothetical protein